MRFQGILDCLMCLCDRANRKFMGYNLDPMIPPEVVELEILTRLSVKSLLRFKSVYKSWNLPITGPDFISKHNHVHNLNEDVLLIWSRYRNKLDSLHPKLTTIIGSFDGLVCFSDCYAHDNSKPFEILLWNPATKWCLKITPLPDESAARYFYDFVGFGYDSIANDFKVMYATRFEEIEQQPFSRERLLLQFWLLEKDCSL
ncbi:F-box protein CPR1-like [Apium graveolens]|uniref:F-box protein CPR1-like n=1 Tax=Apium graveolens TaxID=4045 RepID=UPI003D7A1CF8